MSGTLAKEYEVTGEHHSRPPLHADMERAALTAEEEMERSARLPSGGGRRRATMVAAIAIALAAGAVGGWYLSQMSAGAANGASKDGADERRASLGFTEGAAQATGGPAAGVELLPVETVPRRNLLRLTGTLNADEQSGVASNVNGIVAEVRVDRGSVVKKGDVLVVLDPTDAKNKLAEGIALADELRAKLTWDEQSGPFVAEEQPEVKLAKAAVALAASRKQRAEILLPKNAISKEEWEQQEAEYEYAAQRYRSALQEVKKDYQCYRTAVVKLAALRKAVADTTIKAPFDGEIAEKHVTAGEQVTGGFVASKIVTMVKTNPLRLSMTLPQQDIGGIKEGQKVFFHVDSFPDKTFEAQVRYISPAVASDTRSLLVEALFDNAEGILRPGLFATAELQGSEGQMGVLAPLAAVQKTDEVARVLVDRDGIAREQIVALGEEIDGKVEIRSGLKGGEKLVARPELYHDGDKVR